MSNKSGIRFNKIVLIASKYVVKKDILESHLRMFHMCKQSSRP